MVFSTKAKLFLKKHTPAWLFSGIHAVAKKTILVVPSLMFNVRTRGFTKRTTKTVHYNGKQFDIVIDPKNGYLDAQIYALPLYEPHIVREFVENIHTGDVCLDIGANIGHHTIIMSQAAGETGKVVAFEPIPYIRKQMEESILLNGITNIDIIADGLSDKEDTLSLYLNKENIAGSSLVNKHGSEAVTIHLKTLDSYNYPVVSFMKIDVEGFEYNVLAGAEATIARCRPRILFEFSPEYYRTYNPRHSQEIMGFFVRHNYTLLDLENDRQQILDTETFLQQFTPGMRSQTNILALPK